MSYPPELILGRWRGVKLLVPNGAFHGMSLTGERLEDLVGRVFSIASDELQIGEAT